MIFSGSRIYTVDISKYMGGGKVRVWGVGPWTMGVCYGGGEGLLGQGPMLSYGPRGRVWDEGPCCGPRGRGWGEGPCCGLQVTCREHDVGHQARGRESRMILAHFRSEREFAG